VLTAVTSVSEVIVIFFQLIPGSQPALHFGGGDFHEISFDDVIVLIQPW